jgi:hypothetical protein
MIHLPHISGFRSGIINALIDCLARQRPVAGPGILTTEGPGGTVISLLKRTPDTFTLPATAELLTPDYVFSKTVVDGVTTYGWTPTVTHASQHPESE